MLKRWVVAQRRRCLGGPTGFLDGDEAVKTYFTRKGAQRAVRSNEFPHSTAWGRLPGVMPGDIFIVRARTAEDQASLDKHSGRGSGAVPYFDIPSIDGVSYPVHPSHKEEYERSALLAKEKAAQHHR